MGSGWHMFSENTLLLYQEDLQLGPHILWNGNVWSRVAQFSHRFFYIIIIVVQIHRVVLISENLGNP